MNRTAIIGGVLLAALGISLARASEADDVAAGHTLAMQLCSACHRVSPDQPDGPKLPWPGPAFVAIANGPDVSEGELYEFLLANHASGKTPPNMPALVLTEGQAKAATAYLMSLRKPQAAP
jgi:mono/diheme cytochrome c family protein